MADQARSGFAFIGDAPEILECVVAAADTAAYAVGDPVKLTGELRVGLLPSGKPTQGTPVVARASSGGIVSGVVAGVEPGPGVALTPVIPATKARDYVVRVRSSQGASFEIQCDNAALLTSAGNGAKANFVVGAPNGSVSGFYVDSSSFGTGGDLLILGVAKNTGGNSTLIAQFLNTSAVAPPVSGAGNATSGGYKTVLFGDSMTSQYHVDTAVTASYSPSTGLLTVNSSGHSLATGWSVDLNFRNYILLRDGTSRAISRVDANNFTVQLEADRADLPNGALAGTLLCRVPSRQGSNSWVNWLQMLMKWPFNIVHNGGVSGDTTQMCLNRLQTDCLDYEPQVVLMQMPGINDMSVGNGPIDEETIYTNQVSIIDQIAAAGAFLVILPMTPVYTGEARATLQNMSRVARLNRRLMRYVQNLRSAVMIDSYGLTVNPTSATGLATADYVKSTDFIHYSIPGALRVGKAVKAKLDYLFATDFDTRPRSAVDSFGASDVTASSVTISGGVATFNSTAHGMLAGESVGVFGGTASAGVIDGWVTIATVPDANSFTFATSATGTVTGTVTASRSRNVFEQCVAATATGGTVTAPVTGVCADGFNARFHSGSGTAVASVPAQADGFGNAQRLVVSAAVADALPGFQSEVTSTLNKFALAGERYFLECDLRIASANWPNTPISEIMVRLIVTVDGVLYSAHALNTYDGLTGASVAEDLALHVRTPHLLIPAGTASQFYWQAYVRASGTVSSNLTLDLSRVAVQRVD